MMSNNSPLFFTVAGRNAENISECKVFSDYSDANEYLAVLMDRQLFDFYAIRKQIIAANTQYFVCLKSYNFTGRQ